MSPFKLFSTKTKKYCVLIAAVGCVGKSGNIYSQLEKEPFEHIRSYVTPYDKTLQPIIGRSDPMAADPRRIFDAFCNAGRTKKNLETTIRAILPRQAKGVAIDTASALQEQVYKVFRKLAKKYYEIEPYEQSLSKKNIFHEQSIYALKESSIEQIIKLAKESRANEELAFSLLSANGSKTLFMGMMRLPVYTAVPYTGSEKGLFNWRKTNTKPNLLHAIDVFFPDRPMHDIDGQSFYPLYSAVPFETIFFSRHFTMLIPEETQIQLFGRPRFFIREDGSYDLAKAVEERNQLWEAYIEAQTSLKEAQTDDPQIIDFQVNLDTNIFCRYGRAVSDLITD